ncbi:MAG: flagellar protein export ATPase FliI [Chloroflexota bacterium]
MSAVAVREFRLLERYRRLLAQMDPISCRGRVVQVVGLTVEVEGLSSMIGEMCYIYPEKGSQPVSAEVVGFRNGRLLLMPLADLGGVRPGSEVVPRGRLFTVQVGKELLGRVVDGLGRPIDKLGPIDSVMYYPLTNSSPDVLTRSRIVNPLPTGVKAIDGLLTCGKGQRIGIFAGSGVGKSTLLGMIARNSKADVNVIALIGERGREVQDFIERDLGPEGLSRSVVIVSTSDQSALMRVKGAWVATVIAEYFRDQGLQVAFMMDSVTRFAMAQREIGLAAGEPPTVRGYTPSVFALLPKLMERTGTSDRGAITAFYTVLVEADDLTEPITDTARSILDGHIVLSRELVAANRFPAIDILNSASRLMVSVTSENHQKNASMVREALAIYQDAKDLINIGAYVRGSNPKIDAAIDVMPQIEAFLRQQSTDVLDYETTLAQLEEIAKKFQGCSAHAAA